MNRDGCGCGSPGAWSIPRAKSWSTASGGIRSVASTLINAMPASTQNTTTGPKKYASAPVAPAADALPAWLNASLRPIRLAKN
ncbi:Uncharacterised protein [Mycobacterium tuberculosis]|nr:Uncharacterised protein [Mycobacterium tuberculosis]